jgi:hypothetical protein
MPRQLLQTSNAWYNSYPPIRHTDLQINVTHHSSTHTHCSIARYNLSFATNSIIYTSMLQQCKVWRGYVQAPKTGSEEGLLPFLTWLDVCRQNERWYPATFLSTDGTTTDLCFHFAQVTEIQAKTNATLRWSFPTVQNDEHTIGHPTCLSRQLAIVLMASITDNFFSQICTTSLVNYEMMVPICCGPFATTYKETTLPLLNTYEKRPQRQPTEIRQLCWQLLSSSKTTFTWSPPTHPHSQTEHRDDITYIIWQLKIYHSSFTWLRLQQSRWMKRRKILQYIDSGTSQHHRGKDKRYEI